MSGALLRRSGSHYTAGSASPSLLALLGPRPSGSVHPSGRRAFANPREDARIPHRGSRSILWYEPGMPRPRPRHAFVVSDPTPVSPLGTPASGTWLLDRTLGAQARRALEEAGLAVETVASLDEACGRAAATPGAALVTYDS